MRRTLTALITLSLLAAACGSDDAGTDGTVAPSDSVVDSTVTDGTTPTNPDKPKVEIPDEIPTELTTTVLEEGTGPAAAAGDTVVVDYVGVRSSDGVEFDNSWDSYQPYPVVLGTTPPSVIKGWDEGLVGAKEGSRIQLDVPSDLAYGDQTRGELIGANEALTFVIDVRSVIKKPDPATAPTEAGVEPSEGAIAVTSVDLIDGEGAELEAGQTAVINLVLYRGDNLVELDSTWASDPLTLPMEEGSFPGLVEGLPGMKVGGRRAVTIPPDKGFGPEGNPTMGLPKDTDIVVVVDLLGAY